METTIFIKLLNEGTSVYRPVPARKLSDDVYLIMGENIFDPEDETWEFGPGTRVIVKKEQLSDDFVLIAVSQV